MFIILIVVTISEICIYVKTYQRYTVNIAVFSMSIISQYSWQNNGPPEPVNILHGKKELRLQMELKLLIG